MVKKSVFATGYNFVSIACQYMLETVDDVDDDSNIGDDDKVNDDDNKIPP